MGWLRHHHDKSRLGQLLVKRKLITEEQLRRAIEQQHRTGQRLGEIFAEWNAIKHQHMQEVLHAQRNLRLTGVIAAALLGPLRAFAVVPPPVPTVVQTVTQTTHVPSDEDHDGMHMMSEEDLDRVSAQGLSETLLRSMHSSSKDDGVRMLGDMAMLMNPLLGLLDADVTMQDVVYDPANAATVINKDGSLTLRMPSSIGELNFEHIRVRGSVGPSFGSILIRGIDLTGTTVTLTPTRR